MPTFNEGMTEFPAHFALLKWKCKMCSSTVEKKISADNSRQTSTFLEIQNSNESSFEMRESSFKNLLTYN